MGNKEKFLGFLDEFSNYMSEAHPDYSFYVYGSTAKYLSPQKFYNEEPTDIDGGIIAPEIITRKKTILDISDKINLIATKNQILYDDFQLNFIDYVSGRDGRFLSYGPDFTLDLNNHAEILSGPNKINELCGVDNKYAPYSSFSFKFRYVRNLLLMSKLMTEEDQDKSFIKSVYALRDLPKKIKSLVGLLQEGPESYEKFVEECWVKSKKDFNLELKDMLPDCNFKFSKEFNLFGNSDYLLEIRNSFNSSFDLWAEVVSNYESIIKAYIEKFPPKKVIVETLI